MVGFPLRRIGLSAEVGDLFPSERRTDARGHDLRARSKGWRSARSHPISSHLRVESSFPKSTTGNRWSSPVGCTSQELHRLVVVGATPPRPGHRSVRFHRSREDIGPARTILDVGQGFQPGSRRRQVGRPDRLLPTSLTAFFRPRRSVVPGSTRNPASQTKR